ncbi:F-box protein [Cardamine amara subsp. amara]|uniref:F-box protein n=1 Tax=Cardamine amara subsp. amara TaxID=228776 RepID=A0ABD1BNU8_CARAN
MEELKRFDGLRISRRNTKPLVSHPIPPDVLMDIISRLPAKSVGKCRCVSKLWALILSRPEFDELFMAKSSTCPQILLGYSGGELPFFTSPQLQNPLVASPHRTYIPDDMCRISGPVVRGWVCIEYPRDMFVICNPMTGKSITLPHLKGQMFCVKSLLGYDPIDKQFKVLCVAWRPSNPYNIPPEHYVLTLGTQQQMVWRTVECCKPNRPSLLCEDGVCINGVLYYMANINRYDQDIVIVCFDIRSEKLSFINQPEDMWNLSYQSRLINHKGRLGLIYSPSYEIINGHTTCFCWWVLKDTEKHEWTKRSYELPQSWWDLVGNTKLRILGTTSTCEIVLSPEYLSDQFYIVYYNFEKNIVRRVGVQGIERFKPLEVFCFLDYLEDLKPI